MSNENKVAPIEITMQSMENWTDVFKPNCFTNAEIGFSFIAKEYTIDEVDGKVIRTISEAELLECYMMDREGNRLPLTNNNTDEQR